MTSPERQGDDEIEEGELDGDDSDDVGELPRVKRERRDESWSSDEYDGNLSRQRRRGGHDERERSWRRHWYQGTPEREWAAAEARRRGPQRQSASERRVSHSPDSPQRQTFGSGPRAQSTALRAPQARQNSRSAARENAYAPQTSHGMTSQMNFSQSGPPKMFKVEPFPKEIKPTDQLQEWNYWLTNFEMAIEKAGITA